MRQTDGGDAVAELLKYIVYLIRLEMIGLVALSWSWSDDGPRRVSRARRYILDITRVSVKKKFSHI